MVSVKTISLDDATLIIDELQNAELVSGTDATVNAGNHSVHGNCAVVTTASDESFLIKM